MLPSKHIRQFYFILQPEIFWNELFLPVFTQIPAAGGVVIRNEKILFIFRNGKWDLPKGKIDNGETAKEAAIREVAEECGIDRPQHNKRIFLQLFIFTNRHIKKHWDSGF